MAHQIDLFCVPQLADTGCLEADHNGGYFASSSWAFVTESDVVVDRQAIAFGMRLWCQAYQGTLAG